MDNFDYKKYLSKNPLTEAYIPGEGWIEDFEYDDMLAHGLTLTADDSIEDLRKVAEDFTDVNYHREAAHLYDAIDAIEAGDTGGSGFIGSRGEAKMYINKFHKEIKTTLAGFDDVNDDYTIDENKENKETKNTKMKKSELKEMIKAAMMDEKSVYEAEKVDIEDNEEVDVDIEKDVEIDDKSVETDIDVKGSMPGEDSDEIAVQSLLMKAQEEAAKLGDEKLTDQIGNTITYFTRAHVATVDEGEEIDEIAAIPGEEGVEDVNIDDPAKDAMVGLTETLRWQRIAGITKDNGLYSKYKLDEDKELQKQLNEGEQWIDGVWGTGNYKDLIKEIENIFQEGGRGASFKCFGKDFTITKTNGDRFLISSSTDFNYEALNINGAFIAAHKFATGKSLTIT
jgi:hypothetical protein